MIDPNPSRNQTKALLCLLTLIVCLAMQTYGQQRAGGAGAAGGGARTSTSSSGHVYPNAGSIGDAYYSIDPESRRVVTIADPETSLAISQVLSNLDRPKPQVLIKVVFVEVTHNNGSDIGIEGGWGRNSINDAITNMSAASGFGLSSLSSVVGTNINSIGQPISAFSPSGAGLYQILGQDYQVTLRAIASAGKAKVLSRPSILARNNQPATITVGQQVPLITSVSYNGLNGTPINGITYTDVGVILKVTPFITTDGLVEMIVSPQISSIDTTLTIPISAGVNAPVIDIRSADTVAVTPDGQTVVIGGLMQNSKAVTDTKVPFLGDIPLLGNLFKRKQRSESKTELIIFLTPHIVQTPNELAALSASERQKAEALKEYNERELHQFLDALPTQEHISDAPPKPGGNGSPGKP